MPVEPAMLYFAYGSNMSAGRMQQRIPNATVLGTARVQDRQLVCNKLGRDGSGKANLIHRSGYVVYGVLYELPPADIAELDKIEGGYRRISIQTFSWRYDPIRAETYEAEVLTDDPTPFEWYRELMLAGARENGLPEDYVLYLEQLQVRPGKS